MSDLKEFVDNVFKDIRTRVESEYQNQLSNHFKNISSNMSTTHFTPNYGQIKDRPSMYSQLELPKPLEGRWWIHITQRDCCPNNGFTLDIYDNHGQCFTRKIGIPVQYYSWNFSSQQQSEESAYQYPLPDSIIDFVKKQGPLTSLNLLGDIFHKIVFSYEI